jgi:hypothetical protein
MLKHSLESIFKRIFPFHPIPIPILIPPSFFHPYLISPSPPSPPTHQAAVELALERLARLPSDSASQRLFSEAALIQQLELPFSAAETQCGMVVRCARMRGCAE